MHLHTCMQIHAVRTQLAAVEPTLHSSGHKKIQCTEEGARSLEKLYGHSKEDIGHQFLEGLVTSQ